LHGSQVRAGVEEVGGEGVAERVYRETGALVELVEKLADGELHRSHAQPSPSSREKERGAIGAPSLHLTQQVVAPGLVVPQREHGVIAHRKNALLLPLATHLHLLRDEVEVADVDPGELGEAHACRVEQLEDGEIPNVL